MDRYRKVIVDFEWHKISNTYKRERLLCDQEIIQFGAVMQDENNQEMGIFHSMVRPQFVLKYSAKIEELTGISEADLSIAPSFEKVFFDFLRWCDQRDVPYIIYSWSDNDLQQIKNELMLKQITCTDRVEYMLCHWRDLQVEFDDILGFYRRQSLENAMMLLGIEPEGRAHNALDDAKNTAILYTYLTDPVKQRTVVKKIKDILTPEEKGTTLGDLFDFNQLFQML